MHNVIDKSFYPTKLYKYFPALVVNSILTENPIYFRFLQILLNKCFTYFISDIMFKN